MNVDYFGESILSMISILSMVSIPSMVSILSKVSTVSKVSTSSIVIDNHRKGNAKTVHGGELHTQK